QIYPLTPNGGLDRVWAAPRGDVFASGDLLAVLHRFPDGTAELLPSKVYGVRDFHGDASRLYALAPSSLWFYELGDVESSAVASAAAVDEALLDVVPSPERTWGRSAASNFEPLDCVDAELDAVGAPAFVGELLPGEPEARYGSCS